MIPAGAPCEGCGDRCDDCGERMCMTNGPAPIPTCPDHPTCIRCALAHPVVYCPECQRVAIEGREDRAEQVVFDAQRERA